jgi:hypothetical protein
MADDDSMASVGIGPVETGVPLPRADGFIGRLRQALERLEVGDNVSLLNVSWTQEKYIRSRLPTIGRDMKCHFSARVANKKRDRSGKRTLRVWRLE